MALKLQGYDDTTTEIFGRYTSLTFLQYIHNQIAHLFFLIQKMSIALPFLNIVAIEGLHALTLCALVSIYVLFMCHTQYSDKHTSKL